MSRLESRVRFLSLTGVCAAALLSTACFTPADFGAGVAAGEHGAAEGEHAEGEHAEGEHAEGEHAEGEHAEGEGEYIVEGILPGTQGKTLEIELPEIAFEAPFDGKALSSNKVEGGVVVEDFVLGEGEAVADNTMISFNFKGYATANARQVMGSRGRPSKLVINDMTREQDPIAKAIADGLSGMKAGGKRRVTIPAAIVEEGAPPGRPSVGDLVMTVELVSVEAAPELAGVEAYSGTPVNTEKLSNGLEIYDYAAGEGPAAKEGDRVVTHYIGHLADGTQFDSSHSKAEGLPVNVGGGGVIKGFAQGVVGAKVGMLRKVVIPPELGYGSADRGKIPPNSTLTFYLQIMEVVEGGGASGPQQSVRVPREGAPQPTEPKPKPKPKPEEGGGE